MIELVPIQEHPDLAEWTFHAGDRVVMEHVNAAGLMSIDTPEMRSARPTEYAEPYDHSLEYGCMDTIGIVRPGGIGDIVFLSPFVREMKARHPEAKVVLFAFPRFHEVGKGIFNDIEPYPMHADRLRELAALVWLENVVENNPEGEKKPYFELLCERFGFRPESQELDWKILPEEANFARDKYPKGDKPRIGIQCYASSPARSWPAKPHLSHFVNLCVKNGWQPFLFGKPGEIKGTIQGTVNLSQHGLNLRQSAAVLDTCDVVVAPDSALCHIGAALKKPVVALYGSFPWQFRTAGQPTVRAITGQAECAPCFWHGRLSKWPKGKPCATTDHCKAMADISPERVILEVKKRLEEI